MTDSTAPDGSTPASADDVAVSLEDWVSQLADELGLPAAEVSALDLGAVLDLTRVVAHGVARPAGPLTTFLVGYAAGRAGTGLGEVGPLLDRAARSVSGRG